jgi:predicted PurR-regulated permease PerM
MAHTPSIFYRRVFGSVTAVILAFAVLRILAPFVGPLLWAALLAFMLFPLYRRLTTALRGRPSAAAALLTVASVLMVAVPAVLLGMLFGSQATHLVRRLQADAAQYQIQDPGTYARLADGVAQRVGSWVPIPADHLRDSLLSAGQQLVQSLMSVGDNLFASVLSLIVAIGVALFLLFFFLRDGEQMVTRAMGLVPLDDRRKAQLLSHLADVTRAVVLGSLVTSLVQGALLGIGFALAGLPSPIVFGVLSVGAALIPVVGTALVWVPAAAWAGMYGHWGTAAFLALWGGAVIPSADHVVRPLFISSRAKITTLPVFIGLLGGIAAFGAIGIFVGPVLIALVLALVGFAEEARSESPEAPPAS